MSTRGIKLEFVDTQDWRKREEMVRRMSDSLMRWLGLDKPPQQRARLKVCMEEAID